jgi:hypothetical protein
VVARAVRLSRTCPLARVVDRAITTQRPLLTLT